MKLKVLLTVVIIVLVYLLMGCLITTTPSSSSASPTQEPINLSTASSTSTTVTSPPILEPSQTYTLSPTMISPIESSIQPCFGDGVPMELPSEFGFVGSIVFWDPKNQSYSLVGGQPLTISILQTSEGANADPIGFTPDGKWFAYLSGSPYDPPLRLHLLSFDGQKITFTPEENASLDHSSPYPVGGWEWSGWLNDKIIYVHLSNPSESELTRTAFSLFNVSIGEWLLDSVEQLPERTNQGGVVFSPDLSRVLYVTGEPNQTYNTTLVLYDWSNQTVVWRQDNYRGDQFNTNFGGTTNVTAAWAPNSSLIAYTGPETTNENTPPANQQSVFLLDRNGLQSRLITNFFGQYDSSSAKYLTWSPDSRYLAFAIFLFNQGDEVVQTVLYVYDTTINQLVEVCPIYGDIFLGKLIWSPDSHYLAYTVEQEENSLPYPLILIDIFEGFVFKLAEDVGALGGWSTKFQP